MLPAPSSLVCRSQGRGAVCAWIEQASSKAAQSAVVMDAGSRKRVRRINCWRWCQSKVKIALLRPLLLTAFEYVYWRW